MPRKAKIDFSIRTITPAFLYGAPQDSDGLLPEWRVPPIKHLLREWWRCHKWNSPPGITLNALLEKERLLFGGVHGESAVRSKVEIVIDKWGKGELTYANIPVAGTVRHPEVRNGGREIDQFLYLGYGPLVTSGQNVILKNSKAIGPDQTAKVTIYCPASEVAAMNEVLALIHNLGTIGGRSRNGWGSVEILDENGGPLCSQAAPGSLSGIEKDWENLLVNDWSTGLGTRTVNGTTSRLVWRTGAINSWDGAMKELAKVKVKLRACTVNSGTLSFTPIPVGTNKFVPNDRHLMGYPITNHNKVNDWKRLANQLRFKVIRKVSGQGTEYYGIAYHMPHGLPVNMQNPYGKPSFRTYEVGVWQRVHNKMDKLMTPWP